MFKNQTKMTLRKDDDDERGKSMENMINNHQQIKKMLGRSTCLAVSPSLFFPHFARRYFRNYLPISLSEYCVAVVLHCGGAA